MVLWGSVSGTETKVDSENEIFGTKCGLFVEVGSYVESVETDLDSWLEEYSNAKEGVDDPDSDSGADETETVESESDTILLEADSNSETVEFVSESLTMTVVPELFGTVGISSVLFADVNLEKDDDESDFVVVGDSDEKPRDIDSESLSGGELDSYEVAVDSSSDSSMSVRSDTNFWEDVSTPLMSEISLVVCRKY